MDYELYAHDPELATAIASHLPLASVLSAYPEEAPVVLEALDLVAAEAIAESSGRPVYDYDLLVSRSQPRLKTGEIAFECKYHSGGAPVKVGLTAFFDKDDNCTDGEVCAAVNNWCAKAWEFPNVRRKCLTCRRRAVKGTVTCGLCDKKWGAAIYA